MSIKSVDKWIEFPNGSYDSYLLIQTQNKSVYVILSTAKDGIIYRDGYFEAGDFFKVYRNYKGIWTIEDEGFGSPTNLALYIGDLCKIARVSSNSNIVNLHTGEIIIEK